MKIKANGYHSIPVQCEIEEEDALIQMINAFAGQYYWAKKTDDGRYVLMEEVSAGCHSIEVEVKEIEKADYEYVTNLKNALFYIRNKRSKEIKTKILP